MIEVGFADTLPESTALRFAVTAARHKGKWVYSRQKGRDTYENPGGHIEAGESCEEAAKRELYEETGASVFTLDFVSYYFTIRDEDKSWGALFFADISKFSPLPAFEMDEVAFFDRPPEKLTYPEIQPRLHNCVQNWLNLQSNSDELWDVYDSDRALTGKTHRRGDPLREGDYHLVVHVWIQNSADEFLITKRTPNKGYPNMWECTGGSAVTGDDSLAAAMREVREETGLNVSSANGSVIFTLKRNDCFADIWLFCQDFDINDVVYQPNETCGAMWASPDKIRQMIDSGEFIPFHYIDELFEKLPPRR